MKWVKGGGEILGLVFCFLGDEGRLKKRLERSPGKMVLLEDFGSNSEFLS